MASTRDETIIFRARERQKVQWQAQAEAEDLSLSEWLRMLADQRCRVMANPFAAIAAEESDRLARR